MENNEYGLQEIHKELLEALDKIDDICRKNHIYYSLHGGALLGAERNGKLIPWDDDLDISMSRSNFNRFEKACENLQGDYYLNEIDTWLPRFATKDKSKNRVFIDIFIWDYISENKVEQFLKINTLRALQGSLKRNIDYSSYNTVGKILVGVTNTLGKPFDRREKLRFFKKVETQWFLGHKRFIHRSNDAFKGVSYIFDTDYMKHYSTIELEGKRYMVFKRYHEFLERNYGPDYLTPPPVSERKPLHETQRENFLDE